MTILEKTSDLFVFLVVCDDIVRFIHNDVYQAICENIWMAVRWKVVFANSERTVAGLSTC